MDSRISKAIVAALTLLSAPPALAQGPPGWPMPPEGLRGPGGPNLLASAAVQEELALSDKQKTHVKRLEGMNRAIDGLTLEEIDKALQSRMTPR